MKIIKLGHHYINANQILWFKQIVDFGEVSTLIKFINENADLDVKETPEEILNILKNHSYDW